ncbi:MAG: helix-turn-helix domain-containing protein [Lachnospiraceae bacterium]|nr:helix-turn-helix domain-containing protein [Lachnospiraceae bacterium]
MAVLKNKTQNNFTMISNSILRDKDLSMKDRGVLCTLCSLPDGWNFSVGGLCSFVSDGKDSVNASLKKLEQLGYLVITKTRGDDGTFKTEIEIFTEKAKPDMQSPEDHNNAPSKNESEPENHSGFSVTDKPQRVNRDGFTVTVYPKQYNTNKTKTDIKTDYSKSINLSWGKDVTDEENDLEIEVDICKKKIAENIKLNWLLEQAKNDKDETAMVKEIYDVICDMVCYPREKVVIQNTNYPWQNVKNRFLQLRYDNVSEILNRIIDKSLGIKKMPNYLITTLYNSSLVGTIETQASLHDEYLKKLRGRQFV